MRSLSRTVVFLLAQQAIAQGVDYLDLLSALTAAQATVTARLGEYGPGGDLSSPFSTTISSSGAPAQSPTPQEGPTTQWTEHASSSPGEATPTVSPDWTHSEQTPTTTTISTSPQTPTDLPPPIFVSSSQSEAAHSWTPTPTPPAPYTELPLNSSTTSSPELCTNVVTYTYTLTVTPGSESTGTLWQHPSAGTGTGAPHNWANSTSPTYSPPTVVLPPPVGTGTGVPSPSGGNASTNAPVGVPPTPTQSQEPLFTDAAAGVKVWRAGVVVGVMVGGLGFLGL